jgi:hypothetical protein
VNYQLSLLCVTCMRLDREVQCHYSAATAGGCGAAVR